VRNSILYYPTIEIRDEEWLKSALLVWDKVYRIVPKHHTPNDSDEIKEAIDNDLIRSIVLEEDDLKGVSSNFTEFMESLPFTPAGLEESEPSLVHPDKIDASLYPILDAYSRGYTEDGWLELPSELARGYMYFLAQVVAERRQLERGTNDPYNFAVGAYFSELANFDEHIYNKEASGYYSSLIMNDIIPRDLASVPMKNIVTAIDKSKDEKSEFRKELLRFSEQLHTCESTDHARLIFTDYKNDLMRAKGDLRSSQGFLNKGAIGSLFAMGTPTSLTAFGAMAAVTDPFSLTALSSSMLIGAVASYVDYKRVSSTANNPVGGSYLISLDKSFSGTNKYPAFDRHLEEFIND
jgi:hypothetical protein